MRRKKDDKDVEKGAADTAKSDDKADDKPTPSANVTIAQRRMQQTQAQVDEVTEIMRVNVEKVLERDAMISQLDERADALKEGAEMFEKQAGALKSKYWWKNMKMIAVMVGVGLVFVFVIFAWFSKKD
ncbi:synaptobrevin-like protein 2 [Leptotrombidium deliense]|uniref:Synaptobrevin-like protein 2 n=1 Tax=Leptotrombidium deliense TaxID=299467 RepID=A0A443SCV7_9ACAR|nr:synaptobrevin-like protein 2 [Leptotrombidium deliense]